MDFHLTQKLQKNKWIRTGMVLLLLGFMAAAFVSFIYAPFTGDIEVFIAAENQVKYKEIGGLKALFEAWELKGIANRSLMYLLYRLALIFVPYGHVTAFELVVKSIYAVIVLFFIWRTSILISKDKKTRAVVFVTEFIAVFCTYTASQLQAEMTCVILSCFIFALLVHGGKKCLVAAGMFGGGLFFYKSIFFLLFFVALLGATAYTDKEVGRKESLLSIGSFAITELVLIIFVKLYYPQEFKDMSAAAVFQTTLFSKDSNVGFQLMMNSLQNGFTQAAVGMPFLLMGVCVAVAVAIWCIRKKDWECLTEIIIMWILTLDIIIMSNQYFLYHYYLLTLPAFICILLFLKRAKPTPEIICFSGMVAAGAVAVCWVLKDGLQQTPFINHSTVLLVIIHLVLFVIVASILQQYSIVKNICVFLCMTACIFFYLNYSSFIAPKFRNERQLLKWSEETCVDLFPDDFREEPVLFLDGGVVPFYVDAPSYSRYFFNLPMQRWKEGDDWELQREEYEKVMQYDGKYIVYTGWFGLEKYPDLQAKIQAEYERIPNSGIGIYYEDWNFFKLSDLPDIEDIRRSDNAYILKRK